MTAGDDALLLARLRLHDERAWNEVVSRYSRLVWSIARSFGLDEHDAADVAQHAFTELLRQLDRIQDAERIGAWLATVARRATWRLVERQRRPRTHPIDEDAIEVAQPDDIEQRTENLLWIDAGLAALSPRCRELIEVLYLSGTEPTYEEVSRRLGIPIGSIGPTRQRCLAHLERALRELDGP